MSPVAHIPFETTQTVDRRNNHTTTTADVLFNNKPSLSSSSSAVRILPSYRDDQVSLVFPKPIFAGHLPQHSLVAAFAPLWDQYELLEEAFPSSQEVSHGDQRLQQLNDMACNGQTPVAAGAATLVENQRGDSHTLAGTMSHTRDTSSTNERERRRRPRSARPSSQSIRIKRSQQTHVWWSDSDDDDFSEMPSGSTERMYDCATWRMYNRIIDHRQRFPVGDLQGAAPGDGQPHLNSNTGSHWGHYANLIPSDSDHRSPAQSMDYSLEGGVFDFEI